MKRNIVSEGLDTRLSISSPGGRTGMSESDKGTFPRLRHVEEIDEECIICSFLRALTKDIASLTGVLPIS